MRREYRLLILLGLIIVISFAVFSLFNYRNTSQAIREEIVTSSLPLLRDNIYSEMLKMLMPPINISSLMAKDSFLIDWAASGELDSERVIQYLREIQRHYGFYSTFFVSSNTRNYYYYNGILKQLSEDDPHDVWFQNFVDSGLDLRLEVDRNQAAEDSLTIFLNFRLEDFDGNLLGVTGVGLQLEHFSGFLDDVQQRYQRTVYLVDSAGTIQAQSTVAAVQADSIFDDPAMAQIAPTLLAASEGPINSEYIRENGVVLVTSLYMQELDWYLIVEQDELSATSAARNSLWQSLILGIITAAFVVLIAWAIVFRYNRHLELLATTDALTGAANRREFQRAVEQAIYRHGRSRTNFSIIILDLDNFKKLNDRDGHLAGDQYLRDFTAMVRTHIRPSDTLARFGGDEFVILQEASEQDALASSERIRQEAARGRLTVSAGVAGFVAGETLDDILKRADRSLYRAKSDGKNRSYKSEDSAESS